MISIDTEKMIRKLLSENKSRKVIADRFKLSTTLVRHIEKLPGIRKRRITKKSKKKEVLTELKEAKRCPICGGKVNLWPCVICNPQAGCY